VVIAENAASRAEDHRPMSLDQDRERQLRGLTPAGRESLEKLSVGQSRRNPLLEKCLEE
jgi:hypothetical protein